MLATIYSDTTGARRETRTKSLGVIMKARTSGKGGPCEAVQYSDQMQCIRCGYTYDVNDDDPPECKRRVGMVPELGIGYGKNEAPYQIYLNGDIEPKMSREEFIRLYGQRPKPLAPNSTECRKNLKEMFDNSE